MDSCLAVPRTRVAIQAPVVICHGHSAPVNYCNPPRDLCTLTPVRPSLLQLPMSGMRRATEITALNDEHVHDSITPALAKAEDWEKNGCGDWVQARVDQSHHQNRERYSSQATSLQLTEPPREDDSVGKTHPPPPPV
ncbi:hypothetical protein BaRGS_00034503 [Batillaria attramentaria]|uniref:Uncharacterized protein n=1 Tax=Batillaria attramentaria TaxID=370345 RepID=A0ABD0JH96_9CAEN